MVRGVFSCWVRWARYDLPAMRMMMALYAMRSRIAMAKGGSPRYSLQALKSMLVTRAVDRRSLRASITL